MIRHVWHKNWQAILILVSLIGVLGFIGINQLIIYNQKQQFKAAEESLDKLYAEIVSKVGQPTNVTKDKSCGYASTEIGRGRIGCSVSVGAEYTVTDYMEATYLSDKIGNAIKTYEPVGITYERKGEFVKSQSSSVMDYSAFTVKFNNINKLSCDISIKYSDKDDIHNTPAVKHNNIQLYLGCGGYPRTEIYPVTN